MAARTIRDAAQEEKYRAARRQDDRPSVRQVYCMAHLMAELVGLDWPADRRGASAMIDRLRAQREAIAAHQSREEMPF